MDGKEIFNEILKSRKMKELLGVPESEEINENYDSPSKRDEIAVVQSIIQGQIQHSSDDAIFKNLRKLFDL
jgi:hypothetical protein